MPQNCWHKNKIAAKRLLRKPRRRPSKQGATTQTTNCTNNLRHRNRDRPCWIRSMRVYGGRNDTPVTCTRTNGSYPFRETLLEPFPATGSNPSTRMNPTTKVAETTIVVKSISQLRLLKSIRIVVVLPFRTETVQERRSLPSMMVRFQKPSIEPKNNLSHTNSHIP